MITIIFMFATLLIQVYSIPIGDNEGTGITKGRYHFNHPPIVAEYNPIAESVRFSQDSDYKPRIHKHIGNSEDEFVPSHNISAETVLGQLSNDNDRASKASELKSKGSDLNNETMIIKTESIKLKNEDEFKNKSKNSGRKGKIQKRIVRQISKPSQDFQSTTLKPIVTSHNLISSDKVSSKANSKNLKERRERDPVVPIVESENYVYAHNGNFHYSYVGGDGTTASEKGILKVFDDKTAGEAVVGSFSYTDEDGNDFSLTYTADENGYRPTGAHLPTPPPIPPAIARALQYLSTKTIIESTTKI